jgi:hypothetical protein
MPTSTRPLGRLDADGRANPYSYNDNAFRGQYSGSNLIYKGEARPGASESALVWQIALLAYDGSGNVTSITWPQNGFGVASNDFAFSWTNRASYTYS